MILHFSQRDKGSALVIAILATLVISVIAGSLIMRARQRTATAFLQSEEKRSAVESFSEIDRYQFHLREAVQCWVYPNRCRLPNPPANLAAVTAPVSPKGAGFTITSRCLSEGETQRACTLTNTNPSHPERVLPKVFEISLKKVEGGNIWTIYRRVSFEPEALKNYPLIVLAQPRNDPLQMGPASYEGKTAFMYASNPPPPAPQLPMPDLTLRPGNAGISFADTVETNVPEANWKVVKTNDLSGVDTKGGVIYGSGGLSSESIVADLSPLIAGAKYKGSASALKFKLTPVSANQVRVDATIPKPPPPPGCGDNASCADSYNQLPPETVETQLVNFSAGEKATMHFPAEVEYANGQPLAARLSVISESNVKIMGPIVSTTDGAIALVSKFGNVEISANAISNRGGALKDLSGVPLSSTEDALVVQASLIAPNGVAGQVDPVLLDPARSCLGRLSITGVVVTGKITPFGMSNGSDCDGFNSKKMSYDPKLRENGPEALSGSAQGVEVSILSQDTKQTKIENIRTRVGLAPQSASPGN